MVSLLSYVGASALLYRLVALDFPERVAARTVLYLSIFPTAYFLHAAYSEALFIMLVLGSFYAARCERWALAGTLGAFATLTRITGFGLIPALLIEYLLQKRFRLREIGPDVLYLGLVPVGFAVYMLVNYVVLGDPIAFLDIARDRHFKYLSAPWVGIERVWGTAMTSGPRWMVLITVYEVGLGLAALAVALVGALRLRLSYVVFALLAWANFGFNSWWISTARYLLVLFPVFIVLALWGERRLVHWAISFAFVTSYTILMLVFVQGPWTF
jgi:Gpi18-like mannosyltransferase